MRGSQFLLAGWMFALPLLVRGLSDTSDENSLGNPQDQGGKSITPTTSATPTATSTTSTSDPYSFSSTTSATPSTTSRTLDVSSLISSLSSDIPTGSNSVDVSSLLSSLSQQIPSSIITSKATASATGASSSSGLLSTSNFASSGSPASTAPPLTSAVTSSSMSHQDLSIVLAVVLSLLGLILIAAALFLLYRYRSGRSPFNHRGTSPIDDDEIATWRGAMIDPEGPPMAMNQTDNPKSPNRTVRTVRQASTITFTDSPGWTWTVNSSPASTRSGFVSGETVPNTPSFLARAPNARTGLTDEAIPGADPFITPVKRQSSRLSKMPRGHGRSKSRRSSISAKSITSYHGGRGSSGKERIGMWYDPDDEGVQKDGRKSRRTNSSPNTSVFDECRTSVSGGLSPRPKSHSNPGTRDRDIGRAMQ